MSGRRGLRWLALGLAALASAALAATGPELARPSALSRELDRAQALLALRLASLPEDSGVLILRDPASVTLRIPARLIFAYDTPALKQNPTAAAPLNAAVQLLKKHRKLKADIVVYTDSLGAIGSNQSLSDQRAQSVYEALSAAGIALDRLQQHGAGAATMVAGNQTPQGRIANRRIEIEFKAELAAAP
jgi:outer membrane protein OmpA-like peptidoglycan-associated protein